MIPFGEYSPDNSDFNGKALPYMRNAQPVADGWAPFPSFEPYTDPLPEKPCGAFLARRDDGAYVVYAGGPTRLFRLDPATNEWVTVGSGYTLAEGVTWAFAQWGQTVVATNQNTNIQQIDLASYSPATELVAIKARSLFVIGANLFAGGLLDLPDGVQWSADENIASWPIAENGGDRQAFPDGGWVLQGFSGQQGAYILQKDAIRTVNWNPGGTYNFTFSKVAEIGIVGPNAGVTVNQATYFLAQDGFYGVSYTTEKGLLTPPIGGEKVNRAFMAEVDLDALEDVQAVSDPLNKVVYWAYRTTGYTGARFNVILGYDWQLGRWFRIERELVWLANLATPGNTLESLDEISSSLDDLAISLDSPAWSGGKPVLAAFDTDYRMCFAQGSNMDALFRTAKLQLNKAGRSLVTSVTPMTDAEDASMRIGVSGNSYDPLVWKGPYTRQPSGRIPTRANGKIHQFETTLKGNWTIVTGLDDIQAKAAGRR
ncbi:hypothetical protein [uncultured Cohaesibacter sp.]|uniref:hypothetical protein n=1 Tax=uncultured Cohaesibacter sp. TaxID=1002546 RepID=UPI002AAC2DF0|nr:hypothetical protein [uncultured Cohaesibacter sp.]